MVHKHPHHLSFNGHRSHRQVSGQGFKSALVTCLIAPVENSSFKVEKIKGTQLQVRYEGGWITMFRNQHNQRSLMARKTLAKKTLKITARYKGYSVDAKIFGNLAKG